MGRPSPRNPESWRADRPLYLGGQEGGYKTREPTKKNKINLTFLCFLQDFEVMKLDYQLQGPTIKF